MSPSAVKVHLVGACAVKSTAWRPGLAQDHTSDKPEDVTASITRIS